MAQDRPTDFTMVLLGIEERITERIRQQFVVISDRLDVVLARITAEQGSGAFSKCRTSSYSPASYGQMCALPKLHAREYRGHGHGGADPVPKCSR